jgi:hypothetical protein
MADGRAERCERCKFWDAEEPDDPDNRLGYCNRFPPPLTLSVALRMTHEQVLADPQAAYTGVWPETERNDWCGEFAPRPDAPPPGADDPRPLAALGLPTRLVNVLRKEDRIYPEPWQPIRTVGELVRRSADELEGLNNFGPGFTAKVRRALAARGLALRGDPPAVDTAPSDKAEYPQRGASPPPGPSR